MTVAADHAGLQANKEPNNSVPLWAQNQLVNYLSRASHTQQQSHLNLYLSLRWS